MKIGDKVFIFDLQSDLYIKTGEIVAIDGNIAAVMVALRKNCIIDRFEMDKLYVKGA
ncbi:hypothetical protein [Anaerosolibacter sp.]|uniref:hypothetical protein n=1 Tax=Anaerosolibacter sp. TaxID=1872527 RepID=UPI0039EF0902